MATQQVTRSEIEAVIVRNLRNPLYRRAFLRSPKTMVERQLANALPAELEIVIVEEGPKTLYFAVPYEVSAGAELSDEDLEKVAGGKGDSFSCNITGAGAMNTKVSIKPAALM